MMAFDEQWLRCPGCGATCLTADATDLIERRRAAFVDPDVLACWREEVDRDVSGGSDDGLRLVVLRPLGEAELVRQAVRKSPTLVLRIHRVDSTSEEVRQALDGWLRDPPTADEVSRWRDTLRQLRRSLR